jgi:putative transposase
MVYGWELGETMEAKLVIRSFEKAKRSLFKLKLKTKKKNAGTDIDTDKILVHQDQGSQYTSYEYVNKVLEDKFTLSYSTPGTPTENAGQESFFGRLKEECRDEINELKSFKQVKRFIDRRMRYYNNKRIHTSIGYTSPLKLTKRFIN